MPSVFEAPVASDYPFDVEFMLEYFGVYFYGDTVYDYTGDLSLNTEAQYDALVWNDTRPKPSWSDITTGANITDAYFVASEFEQFKHYLDVEAKVNALPDNAGLTSLLDAKQATITAQAFVTDAADNMATNAPTDYTVLSNLADAINDANAKYNTLAAAYNDLADKYNTLKAGLVTQDLMAAS